MIGHMGRQGRALWIGAIMFAGTLIFCGLCFAAEGGHGEGSADLVDLLYRFINFALLVIILVVVLKKVNIKGMLSSRSEELKKRLTELRAEKEEAELKYKELEKRIRDFEQGKQGIIDQYKAEGAAEKNRLIAEAEERVKQILNQAQTTIEREIESAKNRLRKEMVGLAAERAETILSKEITDRDQVRLVDEFIERLGEGH